MRQDYSVLFNILWQHDFYAASMPSLFKVKPNEETLLLMKKHHLVSKTYKDVFTILFDAAQAKREYTRETFLLQPLRLAFLLYSDDPYFLNYTDGLQSFRFGKDAVYLHNNGSNFLHKGGSVSSDDLLPINSLMPVCWGAPPLGVIDILLAPALPVTLTVHFKSLATIWRYVIVTSHLKQLTSPAVINKENKESFIGPDVLTLPDNKQAICFRSPEPIELSYAPEQRYQLVDNYDNETKKFKVVLQSLPSPDITRISVISSDRFSEIII